MELLCNYVSRLSHCFSNDFFVWPEFNVERFFNHSEKLPGIFAEDSWSPVHVCIE
jgi:hypothetical protein